MLENEFINCNNLFTLIPGAHCQQMQDPSYLTMISRLACSLFHSKTPYARNSYSYILKYTKHHQRVKHGYILTLTN